MYLSVSAPVHGNDITADASHPSDYLPPIALRWDTGASRLYISDEQASDLLIDLAEVLFDRGTMSDRAARRVSYLTSIVFTDAHEYEQAAADGAF